MNNRSRRFLMVAFVATALAADRMAAASPTQRPQAVEVARRLAGRLVVSFRRTVPSIRFEPFRRDRLPGDDSPRYVGKTAQSIPHFAFSPFQYRLPPPTL